MQIIIVRCIAFPNLLGENEQADLFKDPAMLKRFQDIATLPEKEKECLLTTVDHFIKASKISLM